MVETLKVCLCCSSVTWPGPYFPAKVIHWSGPQWLALRSPQLINVPLWDQIFLHPGIWKGFRSKFVCKQTTMLPTSSAHCANQLSPPRSRHTRTCFVSLLFLWIATPQSSAIKWNTSAQWHFTYYFLIQLHSVIQLIMSIYFILQFICTQTGSTWFQQELMMDREDIHGNVCPQLACSWTSGDKKTCCTLTCTQKRSNNMG